MSIPILILLLCAVYVLGVLVGFLTCSHFVKKKTPPPGVDMHSLKAFINFVEFNSEEYEKHFPREYRVAEYLLRKITELCKQFSQEQIGEVMRAIARATVEAYITTVNEYEDENDTNPN